MACYELNQVCRICLKKSKNMISLNQPKIVETINILSKLSTLANHEIVINKYLPEFLCLDCKNKTEYVYEFINTIQQSQKFIFEYISERVVGNHQMALNVVAPKPLQVQRTQGFEKIRRCLKCDFICLNNRALVLHMRLWHREMKMKWCSTCNIETNNLIQHFELRHSKELECRVCKNSVVVPKQMTVHLLKHTMKILHFCHFCYIHFISLDLFRKHWTKHEISPEEEGGSDIKIPNQKSVVPQLVKKAQPLNEVIVLVEHDQGRVKRAASSERQVQKIFKVDTQELTGFNAADYEDENMIFCMNFENTDTNLDYTPPNLSCNIVEENTVLNDFNSDPMIANFGKQPYICGICGEVFAKMDLLKEHTCS